MKTPPSSFSKKSKKSSIAIPEYEPETPFDLLIKTQSISGFFESGCASNYPDLMNIPEQISSLFPDDPSKQERVWFTIVALALLESQYTEKKGEWVLIAKKAKN